MNLAFYLVKVGKLHKFGFTNKAVKEKVSAFQRSYPEKVELVASFPTTDGAKNEDYFNEKFKVYKVAGGFFNLPKKVMESRKDWFKSCVEQDATTSFKPVPEKPSAIRLIKPLPPFPEMDSFNELLATGCEMFSDEFNKRYMAMMEASVDRSPEEMEAHYDKWARENMSEEKYEKLQKDMAMLRKRAADRQNRN